MSRYTTRHRANFTADTRTQTAYGTLRAYMSLNAEVAEGAATLGTHRAFIQWGGFTFGRTSSFVDHEGSLGDGGMRSLYTGLVDSTTGAAGINQIAYTWQLGNGITLNVGADDPRNGSIQNLSIPLQIGGSGATDAASPSVAIRSRRARHLASRSVGLVADQPGLGSCEHRCARPQERRHLLQLTRGRAGLCGSPDLRNGTAPSYVRQHALQPSGRQVGLGGSGRRGDQA